MLTTYLGTLRIARLRTAASSSSAGIDGSRQPSENELAIARASGQACRADRERTGPAVKQWAKSALNRALAVRLVLAHPLAGKTDSGACGSRIAGSPALALRARREVLLPL